MFVSDVWFSEHFKNRKTKKKWKMQLWDFFQSRKSFRQLLKPEGSALASSGLIHRILRSKILKVTKNQVSSMIRSGIESPEKDVGHMCPPPGPNIVKRFLLIIVLRRKKGTIIFTLYFSTKVKVCQTLYSLVMFSR